MVVGVDGCPAGWLAAAVDPEGAVWEARVLPDFAALLSAVPAAAAIAVDVPIGLPARGGRACDRLARARLGPRRGSVFPPPSRELLALIADCATYRSANRRCREAFGYGIGAQAFNIHAKIRQVDALMTAGLQRRVREAHPELCFAAMRGAPCAWPKRAPLGRAERLAALAAACPWLPGGDVGAVPRGAAPDDLLDALAAAWTAERIVGGSAVVLPDRPELDPRGLRMEMVT
ncbi:MAG TPA: DUF429 domain-containing protein [Chloroflexota bacterium]|nr:DUF429 domain-containing protein [Chloroflexota bacterium]